MGGQDRAVVRPWLLVVLGLLLAVCWVIAAFLVWRIWRQQAARDRAKVALAASARARRQEAAIRVAAGPPPARDPLEGPDGIDSDGYPLRHVDRVGLRSLLHAQRFADLTHDVEELQAAFEADPRKEYWPIDAGEAFVSAEPELVADLDRWVAATPDSFAPYYARAGHYVAAMFARRGEKYAAETPADDLRAMRDAASLAVADLDRALALSPKLVGAMRQEIRVGMATGDSQRIRTWKDRALASCPGCLQIRATYLTSLTPRWGGSYEAMRAFVRSVLPRDNPRFHVLAGYEDFDRASLEKDDAAALADIDRAVALGEYWEYRAERGRILFRRKRYDEAVAEFDRAAGQRPSHPYILAARATAEHRRKDYLAAGRDLLVVLRLDPTSRELKTDLPYVIQGVCYEAHQLESAGKHEDALEASELAMALGPMDRDAHATHAWLALGDATTPERVTALEARVAADPGDFRSVQQLDYALSRENAFDRILPLWDAYLAVHPDDGRAYMERSGTHHRLGQPDEAREDARRACELGINEGCERAAR